MIKEELEAIGLTEGETKAYLALLELGPSTVGPITKKAKIAYSNIYEILERLMNKGLVSFITKNKTKYFNAVSPERIAEFLEKKEEELQDKRQNLKRILPELKKLTDKATKVEAEIFIGNQGLASAYKKIMEESDPKDLYRFFFYFEKSKLAFADDFFLQLDKEYRQRKIRFKGLANMDFKKSSFVQIAKDYTENRYLETQPPMNIDIYQGKILLTDWNTPMAILIRNKDMAGKFTDYFEEMWKTAKE